MKYLIPAGLVALIFIQWIVPVNMIRSNKAIIKNGKTFRFATEPVDPSNPFTGKYVWLNFKISNYSTITKDNFKDGDEAFVVLGTDKDGFANIKSLSKQKPLNNPDYIKVICGYSYKDGDTLTTTIYFPFTKYYMDEYKAPAAETIYRDANIDRSQKTFALVKVLNGSAVINDVIINEKSLKELVKQQQVK